MGAQMTWVTCMCEKVPLTWHGGIWDCTETFNGIKTTSFLGSKTTPGLSLYVLQQSGIHYTVELMCLTGLPAVQIWFLLKIYSPQWQGKWPLTAEQGSCSRLDWGKNPQIASSTPKQLKSVIKSKGDGKHASVQTFVCCRSKSKFVYIYKI